MNSFGGDWTKTKIEILVEYAQAYLTIMAKYPYWRTLYFDGFAGTGFIIHDKIEELDITVGAARRIVEINSPTSFKGYYFVEKDSSNAELLKENTQCEFPEKDIHIVEQDCNIKLKAMADHLKMPKSQRKYDKVLAYIDPCGMQLEWSSLEALEGIGADVWILVPTGMGVNRLLKNDGKINEAWINRLNLFLGLPADEIKEYFYKKVKKLTLFGEETATIKKEKAIDRAAKLYRKRLKSIFKYVTNPLVLKNYSGTPMYHYLFASNNKYASKIASDIIKKYSN